MRDLNLEHQDTDDRLYAYDFDYIHREYMIKQFENLFDKNNRVLELGCFEGEFTKMLLPYFEEITVVEGSSDLVAKAQKNVNSQSVTFVNSYFENMELEGEYDLIFLIHTLEHLDDRLNILNKIHQYLSANGKLILIVPNANAASRQIAVAMGLISHNTAVTEGEHLHGHRITYNLDTLHHEVSQSKLSILDEGGILFKPLANFQIDQAYSQGIINDDFLQGCFKLGKRYPDLCASIFLVCGK